jgi:hypothetical protein
MMATDVKSSASYGAMPAGVSSCAEKRVLFIGGATNRLSTHNVQLLSFSTKVAPLIKFLSSMMMRNSHFVECQDWAELRVLVVMKISGNFPET